MIINSNKLDFDFSYIILEQLLEKQYINNQQFKIAIKELESIYLTT